MCPKTKDDREEPADEPLASGKRAASAFGARRSITKSGAFPKASRAAESVPPDPRSESSSPPPSAQPRAQASDEHHGTREEVLLIGVETSKPNRYTFVAPRSGKKKAPKSE